MGATEQSAARVVAAVTAEGESLLAAVVEGSASTPVVTSDSEDQGPMRELFVGTGGTIVGRLRDDVADRTFKNVASGARLPWDFKLIKSTNTTAADMIAIR